MKLTRLLWPVLTAVILLTTFFHLVQPAQAQPGIYPDLPEGYYYVTPSTLALQDYNGSDFPDVAIDCASGSSSLSCHAEFYKQVKWVQANFNLVSPVDGVVGIVLHMAAYSATINSDRLIIEIDSSEVEMQVPQTRIVYNPDHATELSDALNAFDIKNPRAIAPAESLTIRRRSGTLDTGVADWVLDHILFVTTEKPAIGAPFDPNCEFVISHTVPISGGQGVTDTLTLTETQTISANLLLNDSFEQLDGQRPFSWVPSFEGVVWQGSDIYYNHDPSYARTLSRSLNSAGNLDIFQGVNTSGNAGRFMLGGYVLCAGGVCPGETVALVWNGIEITAVSPISPSYTLLTGTIASGGGAPLVGVRFAGSGFIGNLYVDDLFVVPVDENNQQICSLEFYPLDDDDPDPPPDIDDPIIIDDFPIPANDAATCYDCILPVNFLDLGQWIRWLQCRISNLFYCSLYFWLLNIGNWVAGVRQQLIALLAWLPLTVQAALNWAAGSATDFAAWLGQLWAAFRSGFTEFLFVLTQRLLESDFVQTVWAGATWLGQIWQLVWGLVQGVLTLLRALYNAVIQLVELVQGMITAVAQAWQADPYTLEYVLGIEADLPASRSATLAALEQDGPNITKVFWLVLSSLAVVDSFAGNFMMVWVYVAAALLSFGVIGWTFKQFYDIVPI